MGDAVSVLRHGHRTWLKWHRARRRGSDPVFTGSRILEGMAMGASVEVDLVVHGERGFAVLHDLALGRESTGSGRVVDKSATELRSLSLRGNDGKPTAEPVMLLEDLAALLAGKTIHPEALLQLDFKEDAAALDAAAIANFGASVGPTARHMILSSGDAGSVRLLSAAAPGIHIGYDPCRGGAIEAQLRHSDFPAFVTDAVAASPAAEMIYLDYRLVLAAMDRGFDLVAAFHAAGRRIDAYTIQRADAETLPLVRRLLALQVDQITTDDPEGLAALL